MVSQAIVLQLSRPVRRRLRRLSRKTRHKVVFRRCQIVLHLANGEHPAAIAVALGCDISTVYRTRQAFLRAGGVSLIPKKSPGHPRRASAPNLKVHLHCPVHPVTVWRYLRRLKWRWHRPVPRVARPDRRYRAKARYLRRLRAQARRGKIHLYYADEMDVALLPTISGRWMRQGQQTQVNTPGQNAKQYVFGAVNYVTGALVWLPWPNKNNVGFRQLLQQVLAQHKQTPVKS